MMTHLDWQKLFGPRRPGVMLCVVGVLLALLAEPVHADIYKCRLANGRTEFSNAPCAGGSGTVTVRPDETVSEQSRAQAERDVARMREFVDQRAAEQRREEAAEQQRQTDERQAAATRRIYQSESLDDCLAELGQQALDAARRAELEAICRAKAPSTPTLIPVPVYGGLGAPDGCVGNVMRLRLAPAEQHRRIALCRGGAVTPPPEHAAPRPGAKPKPVPRPRKPCPPDDRYCVR
jgi:hypothetical protein